MSRDEELLELAAKAAGFLNYTMCQCSVFVETGACRGVSGYYWNPLKSNGDAFELAVKLGMWVYIGHLNVSVDVKGLLIEEVGRDPYDTTRRAIVRAAAEIGKTK